MRYNCTPLMKASNLRGQLAIVEDVEAVPHFVQRVDF